MRKRRPSPDALAVGGLIRRAREAAGLTAAGLAARLGVSRNTVSSYEHGRTSPTVGELFRLSEILGCPAAHLLEAPVYTDRGVARLDADAVCRLAGVAALYRSALRRIAEDGLGDGDRCRYCPGAGESVNGHEAGCPAALAAAALRDGARAEPPTPAGENRNSP